MTTLSEALAPRSDQLNADDLIPGPRTIKITGAKVTKADRQLRITLNYEGDNGKPFKPCKTMGRAMVMVWGITDDDYEQQFVGKSIRVYRDPEVKFGDQGAVGGIRISHMSHIDAPKTVKLTVSQGKKSNFVFQPLPGVVKDGPPAEDKAVRWSNAYLAAVRDAATLADLNTFANSKATKLAELQSARADLHTRCIEALDQRRAELAPKTDGFEDDLDDTAGGDAFADDGPLTDDNPTAQEGPADEQMGEANTDADPANLYLLTKAAIRKAKTVADVDAAMEAFDACDDMPEDHSSEVRRMAANRRGDLGGSDQ